MDPNATLINILAGLRIADGDPEMRDDLNEVADNLVYLSQWLRRGGFPPVVTAETLRKAGFRVESLH